MNKALIGNCPHCGNKAEFLLTPVLEIPIDLPRECENCKTLLQTSQARPKLTLAARAFICLLFIISIWIVEYPFAAYPIIAIFFSMVLIDRTIGRPVIVLAKIKRDFIADELSGEARRSVQEQ